MASSEPKTPFRIGISIGDLNGIGPEIILKTLSDPRIYRHATPIIYGSGKAVAFYKGVLDMEGFNYNVLNNWDQISLKTASVVNCWSDDVNIVPGEYNDEMGKYSLLAIDKAIADLQEGHIHAMVTAPVNKRNIQKFEKSFKGQTEHLAMRIGLGKPLMVLASGQVACAMVTTHIPLKDVAVSITEAAVAEKITGLNECLRQDFLIQKPRIAVLGLNPHAGDGGLLGDEDQAIIAPAIQKAKDKNILAFGPYSADGFYGSGSYRKFDGVLAMYHDQGLVGFKAISFGEGVNFTAGLPVVRTSPDHGTAYDLAGKGAASEGSFRNAFFMALDIAANRSQFREMHQNPLKRTIRAAER
jgi:4-hydroxythreonine-4-phosphate dehydrogenase